MSALSHLGVMVVVSVVMGILLAGLAIPFAGVAGLSASSVADNVKELPASLQAEPLPQRTRFLTSDGKVLATFYDQDRVNVPLSRVAPIMQKAIVAIEDYRFYEHGALDLKGTLRAFVTNQTSDSVSQGGSSITQQMVKLTLLQQAKTPEEQAAATADTYQRKLNELRYAIGVEEKYSKDWILERYLNIAYFGDGAYGIQSAAKHYFGVPASRLKLPQAAMLAGLVQSPSGYDPTSYPAAAKERRNTVIARMAQLNVISRSEAKKAEASRLKLHVRTTDNGCLESRAPFFCDYVLRWLLQDPRFGKTPEERKEYIRTGGLTVHTTIDLRMQRAADKSVRSAVYPREKAIGALALVQPRTGEVRAISQSRPMGPNRKKGQTFLNYVVDSKYGDANGFQPGSTFKAFVLATAIKQGIPLNTSINAPQQVFIPENKYRTCDGPYQSSGTWDPQNSTGAGTYTLYTGTQNSVNTFFAQLEVRTGLCKPYRLAKAMGIDLDDPEHEMVPSFTLGVADVSPLEMAGAYATFAGRGLHCTNRPVTEVTDLQGNLIKDYPRSCKQVMPKITADAVNDVLRGVQEPPDGFGYYAGLALNQPSAGKTGTTTSNRAVWFCGYTPNLAAAAVIAGANSAGEPQALDGHYVGGNYITFDAAAGSTLAGPMWAGAMQKIQNYLPNKDFVAPNTKVVDGVSITVPSTGGMDPQAAAAELRKAGLSPSIGPLVDSSYSYGTVAYTSPGSGYTTTSGSSVTIYVSDGTPYVPPQPAYTPPPAPQSTPTKTSTPKPKPTGGGGGGTSPGNNGNGNGNGNGRGNGNG